MDKAKIWFMDARAKRFLESLAIKGRQILEHSGWLDSLKPGDIVAVKTHMGEAYNVGYLRPIIVRTLVEALKERGLKPFVTDTTTMPYHPWISRTLAIDHLETANTNGFNQGSMGCPVVVADGWLGTDDVIVDLNGRGTYLNKQFVSRAIADADALLSVAHFKGHPAGGYGGALKNIGVGCASKRGKMNLHGALAGDKPVINADLCPGRECEWWQTCEDCCPEGAIQVTDRGLEIDLDACVYCFACANLCINMAGVGAIQRFDHLPALLVSWRNLSDDRAVETQPTEAPTVLPSPGSAAEVTVEPTATAGPTALEATPDLSSVDRGASSSSLALIAAGVVAAVAVVVGLAGYGAWRRWRWRH